MTAKSKTKDTIKWLKPDSNGLTPLHQAAFRGKLNEVPKEILTEQNMLLKDNYGETPLHYASYKGHLDQVAQMFLSENNMMLKNKDGNTPLFDAASRGQIYCVAREVITVENILQVNNDKETPLHYACAQGHLNQIPTNILAICLLSPIGLDIINKSTNQYVEAIFKNTPLQAWNSLTIEQQRIIKNASSNTNVSEKLKAILGLQSDGPETWADAAELQEA